jgi:hypothetical protein
MSEDEAGSVGSSDSRPTTLATGGTASDPPGTGAAIEWDVGEQGGGRNSGE